MTLARFFGWCAFASPAIVIVCGAWLYLHVGIAVIITMMIMFGAGYCVRWLDEGFKAEERIRNYRIDP